MKRDWRITPGEIPGYPLYLGGVMTLYLNLEEGPVRYDPVGRVLCRDEDEKSPQTIPVSEVRKTTPSAVKAQDLEGTQCDVLFVRHSLGRRAKLLPGQPDEPGA